MSISKIFGVEASNLSRATIKDLPRLIGYLTQNMYRTKRPTYSARLNECDKTKQSASTPHEIKWNIRLSTHQKLLAAANMQFDFNPKMFENRAILEYARLDYARIKAELDKKLTITPTDITHMCNSIEAFVKSLNTAEPK